MMNTKLNPFITWDDSGAVGIDDIDDDHKKTG